MHKTLTRLSITMTLLVTALAGCNTTTPPTSIYDGVANLVERCSLTADETYGVNLVEFLDSAGGSCDDVRTALAASQKDGVQWRFMLENPSVEGSFLSEAKVDAVGLSVWAKDALRPAEVLVDLGAGTIRADRAGNVLTFTDQFPPKPLDPADATEVVGLLAERLPKWQHSYQHGAHDSIAAWTLSVVTDTHQIHRYSGMGTGPADLNEVMDALWRAAEGS